MPILNYTTKIAPEKTASEIQTILAKAKAQAVLCEYNTEGLMCAMSFRIMSEYGMLSFRLPVNIEGIYRILLESSAIARRLKTREQSARVAWRITKNWVEAQLAIIEAGMQLFKKSFYHICKTISGKHYINR
jgi:hypothetical protein